MSVLSLSRSSAAWSGLLLLLFLMAGCGREPVPPGSAATEPTATAPAAAATPAAAASPAPAEWPKVLNLCYVPPEDETERTHKKEQLQALETFLSRKLNIPVKSVESGGYSVSIEAMRSRKVDVCEFGAFSYVLANKVAGAQALVVRGLSDGQQRTYHSVLITGGKSKIQTLDDAIARAGELTLSFTDPASTSGHLVPRGHLDSLGVVPEKAFKSVVFSASHPASVLTAVEGKVDVAAVAEAAIDNMVKNKAIAADDVRILWKSPPMPSGPVAIRGDLPEGFRKAVQEAYLAIQKEDPETWKLMTRQAFFQNTIYIPADDSTYDYYRTIARGVESMNLLD